MKTSELVCSYELSQALVDAEVELKTYFCWREVGFKEPSFHVIEPTVALAQRTLGNTYFMSIPAPGVSELLEALPQYLKDHGILMYVNSNVKWCIDLDGAYGIHSVFEDDSLMDALAKVLLDIMDKLTETT